MSNVDSSDSSEQSKPISSIESPLSLDDFAKRSLEKSEIEIPLSLNDFAERSPKKSEIRLEVTNDRDIPVERQREWARTVLSIGLLSLLTTSLLGTAVYIVADVVNPKELSQQRRNMHRELITILWTSQVTLAGSALGFYFGSQKENG